MLYSYAFIHIVMPSIPADLAFQTSSVVTQAMSKTYLFFVCYCCREVLAVYSNSALQNVGLMSDCRCPPTHLTVRSGDGFICENDQGNWTKRLTTTFHQPSVLLDEDSSTNWASPDGGDNFDLTVDLGDKYQVGCARFEEEMLTL
jgi:hypothetical protein